MGKKKFIDKKKAATFQLLARDSLDPNYSDDPSGDRIFVRVDNSQYSADNFFDGNDGQFSHDPNSIFADAPDDDDDDDEGVSGEFEKRSQTLVQGGAAPLPDHIRREILELGFPDDGYNYLMHMREIKNTGGGSVYYHNSNAKLDELQHDLKAYDASRVEIARANDEFNEKSMYSIASRTVDVRIKKAVDPEVAALLDDSDLSRFGSGDEGLEEDFLVKANLPYEVDSVEFDNKLNLLEYSGVNRREIVRSTASHHQENVSEFVGKDEIRKDLLVAGESSYNEKPRVRRILDEQFDMLELQEYGTETEDEYDDFVAEEDEHHEFFAEKLSHTLKNHVKQDLELDDEYKAPAELLRDEGNSENTEPVVSAAAIIQRCREYAEKYETGDQDEDMVSEEVSSDESEVWDCETIISTYSNLDNHPGKIGTPEFRRKKKLAETVSGPLSAPDHVISLKGKAKLPVDYLPHNKRSGTEKVKDSPRKEQQKRKQQGPESKEEKKERKAVVKEERREARRIKKEMKGIYRCEAQRAQRVAAFTGPSSVHLI